jgi:hypothetical protein
MLRKKVALILVCLFLQLFFVFIVYAKPIQLDSKDGAKRYRSEFPVSGIVGLPDDNLLIWNWHGSAQLLSSQGLLSAVFKLPLNVDSHQQVEIFKIIPDVEGLLISARVDQKSVVMLTTKDGKTIDQWHLPVVLSLSNEGGNRKAFTDDGIYSLNEKGKAEQVESLIIDKASNHESEYKSIKVFIDKKVICTDSDLSKLNQHPILCKNFEGGASEFQIFGALVDPPVCGESLLAWGQGIKEHFLAVYSLPTGHKISEKSFKAEGSYPEIVCDSPNKLLVGKNGIEIYAIPKLEKIWGYPIKHGKSVSNIALLEKFIAFEEEGSGEVDNIVSDIVLVRRPRILGSD